ncbi:Fe-S protein assembly co-chaperone HscB [Pedobacter yulinensis]|uniref:Fe-S protein assembly co-chaperone HscB n=1 Tax=Pedobacter yulinensis TaxID=2126353 RepID=A0A2T3HHA0_9SPHI|nr:Fe-S protein assembly co-chaperone HscB [Pedobacter yulinensis]PST81802.1 Fe-S protein assembly co-chaperone HscB [Pedobacter yulinensis]
MEDYFRFYGFQPAFNLDAAAVKARFFELSRKYHPDFFANESPEKQDEVLQLSTLNTNAYKTLSDPARRMAYLLELKGVLAANENYVLPQAFLMDMMEVNEAIMDLQFDPDQQKAGVIRGQVAAIEKEMQEELAALTRQYDETDDGAVQSGLLQAIKDLHYRLKYLVRMQENLAKLN